MSLVWQSASLVLNGPLPKGGLAQQSRDWGIHLCAALLVHENASGGSLSFTSERKGEKNAAKTNGFGFLARAWYGKYRGPSAPRMKQYKSVPCFRIVSDSIHRDALRACAARPNRAALCVYRAVRCGHRALRNSNAMRCVGAGFYPARPCQVIRIFVGADASVRPPMLYRTSCKRCHCETSSQTGRGNPHPPSPWPLA